MNDKPKLTDEQIDIAVNWWGEQVANPRFNTVSASEKNSPAVFAEMLATISSKRKMPEEIEAFKKSLRSLLKQNPIRLLSVDYCPDYWLRQAAEKCDLPVSMTDFPWKTVMWFTEKGGVEARRGYGAETVVLLGTALAEVEE